MVEADVALNFDPHSRTNTTNPMPTNSPILPFLVLTMAGGCGVSNLMKRTGNNSWVCVEMGNGGGQKGGRRVESRHKCPCQGQTREGELHWPQQQAQNGCQSKLQKTRRRCLCALSENHRRHSSLVVWCELMRDPSGGQGGRLDLNRLGWAGIGSRAELWGLWGRIWRLSRGPKLYEKSDTKSHWILKRLLISPCFHPSLPRSIWLGGRIRTGLPKEVNQSVFVCTQGRAQGQAKIGGAAPREET